MLVKINLKDEINYGQPKHQATSVKKTSKTFISSLIFLEDFKKSLRQITPVQHNTNQL